MAAQFRARLHQRRQVLDVSARVRVCDDRRHREGRARAPTAEAFLHAHFSVYFHFVADDPELLALARKNVTAIRTLLDKPDVRTLARCLYDDLKDAIQRGALPPIDTALFAAALSGVAFEISVMMIASRPFL